MTRPLRILQVSTLDVAGGAEQVAMNLHRGFRAAGHDAWLAVGSRRTDDPGVLLLDNERARGALASRVQRLGDDVARRLAPSPAAYLRDLALGLTEPSRLIDRTLGREDFRMPATGELLRLPPHVPDVVHAHNLHGDYFDLREISRLSHRVPVVLTLHDMWTFTGHCAYSLGCERWRTGCGACPDLSLYPRIRRDGTASNLRRKRRIYRGSRLRVAAPSRWLLDKARSSVLGEGMVECRVIPYGIDLGTFRPEDREGARARLGLDPSARIVLYAASSGTANPFKDYGTVAHAVARISARLGGDEVVFVVVGASGARRCEGRTQFLPYVRDRAELADYYRAANLFLHAAKEDNYPNTVLEALACGTPVVATAVGGIPEQIDDGSTGFLVPAGDDDRMAAAALRLLRDDGARREMSARAAMVARQRHDLLQHVHAYLEWFAELRAS